MIVGRPKNKEGNHRDMQKHGRTDTPADFEPPFYRFVSRLCQVHFVCHSSDVAFKAGSIKPQKQKTS
ncbi:hypothetical protein [Rhizobium sp. CBN3]|uniref:hypothetical protein n=1 Tax=Rhizobium sp. CBN3 TaxID=3058045 RepID=UPI0034A05FA5